MKYHFGHDTGHDSGHDSGPGSRNVSHNASLFCAQFDSECLLNRPPGDPVDGVEAPELEVGKEVAHQHRALQHRVEEAAVARHSALLRVVRQESALQIIILGDF